MPTKWRLAAVALFHFFHTHTDTVTQTHGGTFSLAVCFIWRCLHRCAEWKRIRFKYLWPNVCVCVCGPRTKWPKPPCITKMGRLAVPRPVSFSTWHLRSVRRFHSTGCQVAASLGHPCQYFISLPLSALLIYNAKCQSPQSESWEAATKYATLFTRQQFRKSKLI